MSTRDSDKTFAGSIPEFYERYLVPLIFEPYASDLAARLVAKRPRSVLEIAAGTGVLTRRGAGAFAAEPAANWRTASDAAFSDCCA